MQTSLLDTTKAETPEPEETLLKTFDTWSGVIDYCQELQKENPEGPITIRRSINEPYRWGIFR